MVRSMTISVGCSGWSYDDWIGRFYPRSLAKKKGEWLDYYSRFFSTVEINSSFYHPPGERQISSWIKKGRERGEGRFEFSLKMPQAVTHISMVQKDVKKAAASAQAFEKACVLPLQEAGLLGSVLIQLSPHFPGSPENLAVLSEVLDALSTHEYSYAVEFRHTSWRGSSAESICREGLQILEEMSVVPVATDGPACTAFGLDTASSAAISSSREPAIAVLSGEKAPGALSSARHAYIRFHGRNSDLWYGGDKRDDDYRLNRYDYLYSNEQIREWVPRIKAEELKDKRVRIYFNNHARAKAVRNAFQLMDMLALPHEKKEVNLQNQYTLAGFP